MTRELFSILPSTGLPTQGGTSVTPLKKSVICFRFELIHIAQISDAGKI